MPQQKSTSTAIRHYHETTKHTLQRYAAGPEALDWDDQPEAFRWFDGATKSNLPLTADTLHTRFADLYQAGKITPQPLILNSLACLLELSFGLSAWKQYCDAKWALRCNPSSGNLHAEEAYVICNALDELSSGVYHYLSRDHQLEQRCRFNRSPLPGDTLLIGISSIQWREAWKYGERAYRYCQLDTGHAVAALRYAAAALGWRITVLQQPSDDQLAGLLGLDRLDDFGKAEREHPDVLLQVSTASENLEVDPDSVLEAAHSGDWQGRANILSARHMYQWSAIDEVSVAAMKPATDVVTATQHAYPEPSACRYSRRKFSGRFTLNFRHCLQTENLHSSTNPS